MILGDGCTSEELFRYAGRARERGRGGGTERGGDGKKMKRWSVPFPEVICTSDPRLKGCSAACALLRLPRKTRRALCLCFPPRHDEAALSGVEEQRGGGRARVYGAVEEWLPGVELKDESRTGILFCQLECANGNVRAAGKLMNLIAEMPPLSPNAWSIAIVYLGRRCFSVVIFWLFSPPGLAVLRLRVWWWTLSRGNKAIDLGRESMLSSVTYKRRPVKSDLGLEFSNSVSERKQRRRGRGAPPPPRTIWSDHS